MKKIFKILIMSLIINFANAETLGTFGFQSGDDIYEGYQIGMVQPLSEFDVALSLTALEDGNLVTLGAQKGAELFSSTRIYAFFDINRFFWDDEHDHRCRTQLGWGIGLTLALFQPILIDLKYKQFDVKGSDPYTYLGIAYMF